MRGFRASKNVWVPERGMCHTNNQGFITPHRVTLRFCLVQFGDGLRWRPLFFLSSTSSCSSYYSGQRRSHPCGRDINSACDLIAHGCLSKDSSDSEGTLYSYFPPLPSPSFLHMMSDQNRIERGAFIVSCMKRFYVLLHSDSFRISVILVEVRWC